MRNIVTGITPSSKVNVDDKISVGDAILEMMNGKSFQEISPRKLDKCAFMSAKDNPNGKTKHEHVDRGLLFDALMLRARMMDKEENDCFRFDYLHTHYHISTTTAYCKI